MFTEYWLLGDLKVSAKTVSGSLLYVGIEAEIIVVTKGAPQASTFGALT